MTKTPTDGVMVAGCDQLNLYLEDYRNNHFCKFWLKEYLYNLRVNLEHQTITLLCKGKVILGFVCSGLMFDFPQHVDLASTAGHAEFGGSSPKAAHKNKRWKKKKENKNHFTTK